jgi:hypothetical protein
MMASLVKLEGTSFSDVTSEFSNPTKLSWSLQVLNCCLNTFSDAKWDCIWPGDNGTSSETHHRNLLHQKPHVQREIDVVQRCTSLTAQFVNAETCQDQLSGR